MQYPYEINIATLPYGRFIIRNISEEYGDICYAKVSEKGHIYFTSEYPSASKFATFESAMKAIMRLKKNKAVVKGDMLSVVSICNRLDEIVQTFSCDEIMAMNDAGDIKGCYVIKLVNGNITQYFARRGSSVNVCDSIVDAVKYNTISEARNDYENFKDFLAFPARAFLERVVTEEIAELS